jgi:hypothetical protein
MNFCAQIKEIYDQISGDARHFQALDIRLQKIEALEVKKRLETTLKKNFAKKGTEITDDTLICFGEVFDEVIRKWKRMPTNLIAVTGSMDFFGSLFQDMGNLRYIGGDANFGNSQIVDLGGLEFIKGCLYFQRVSINAAISAEIKSLSNVASLGNLRIIGGDVDFYGSFMSDVGNLTYIGGNASFEESQITNLKNLRKIGGSAIFNNSRVSLLGALEEVGGTIFTDTKAQLKNKRNFPRVKYGGFHKRKF